MSESNQVNGATNQTSWRSELSDSHAVKFCAFVFTSKYRLAFFTVHILCSIFGRCFALLSFYMYTCFLGNNLPPVQKVGVLVFVILRFVFKPFVISSLTGPPCLVMSLCGLPRRFPKPSGMFIYSSKVIPFVRPSTTQFIKVINLFIRPVIFSKDVKLQENR
jgi:hypothetical protein